LLSGLYSGTLKIEFDTITINGYGNYWNLPLAAGKKYYGVWIKCCLAS
jgi:hypothetical protein